MLSTTHELYASSSISSHRHSPCHPYRTYSPISSRISSLPSSHTGLVISYLHDYSYLLCPCSLFSYPHPSDLACNCAYCYSHSDPCIFKSYSAFVYDFTLHFIIVLKIDIYFWSICSEQLCRTSCY